MDLINASHGELLALLAEAKRLLIDDQGPDFLVRKTDLLTKLSQIGDVSVSLRSASFGASAGLVSKDPNAQKAHDLVEAHFNKH